MEDCVLWMDKYQPRKFEELTFHPKSNELLEALSKSNDFPHLILYGPDGGGKKTRAHCFLSRVYGEGIYNMNTINKELKLKSKNIPYMVTSSNYHLEFCPSDLGSNDKFIISHVIKETSSYSQLNEEYQKSFKVIILLEADKMSKDAQSALRRTMEKYSDNCRIIMIVNDLSSIIDPIRSRCFAIRIPAPTNIELKDALLKIKEQERELELNENEIEKIIENYNSNTRECITCLQMTSLGNYNDNYFEPDYIGLCGNICRQIIKDKSAKSIKDIRATVSELLIQGFTSANIIYDITVWFIKNKEIKSSIVKSQIISAASFYDIRANNGSKDLIHIEAFIAKIMLILVSNN